MTGARVSPGVLWQQADAEHPGDADARRKRYLQLLIEHGHVVYREPGDGSPLLPCGYAPRRPG